MSQPNTYAPWWATLIGKWVNQSPAQPSKCYLAGRRAYEAGYFEKCIELINRAFEQESPHFPDNNFIRSEAFRYRAYAHRELSHYQRATADFERLLRIQPTLTRHYLELARLHLDFGQTSDALSILNTGISLLRTKQSASLYLERGRIAEREGDFQKAIDDFNFAIYYQPSDAEAWWRRGLLYAGLKDFKKAIVDCRQAIGAGAGGEVAAYYAYGRVLFRSGNYAGACAQLTEAIERAPRLPEPVSLLGRCLVQQESYTQALPILEKAIELGAKDPMTLQAHTCAQQALGIKSQAATDLTAAHTNLLSGFSPAQRRFITRIKIYDRTDESPLFPLIEEEDWEEEAERRQAAEQALQLYVRQALDYPEEACLTRVTGIVRLEFIVERNGHLSGLRTTTKLGFGCEEAALAVVQKMIDDDIHWEPGKIDGIPVRTRYRLPLRFDAASAILSALE